MYSNIIGFNPMLADIPAAQARSLRKEVEQYLQRYPDTEHVDIYLNDLNGQFRGKRLPTPASAQRKVFLSMPRSATMHCSMTSNIRPGYRRCR
ncbi:hypothetical protein SPRA44_70193 [Serratia proteamaculans]|nr:hypothetical protein SPRA44_70193 [Serratia proteamaculans]